MLGFFDWTSVLATATVAASTLFGQNSKSDTLTVNVPATANPYLAGLPAGTEARMGDSSPQQSPVLVERTLSHAVAVTFTAVGAIQHTPECPPDCYGPNGAELARHRDGAEHGISDVIAPNRCSTFNSTLVLPFLSRPTSTWPRAAGTDAAAVSGNFFALPIVVRTVSPANTKTTYGFMKTPLARAVELTLSG